MTTKTLSTYAALGYTLSPSFSELDITTTGGVGGTGVYSYHFATISNAGKVNETAGVVGVFLHAGGTVINQKKGTIFAGLSGVGSFGVEIFGSGTVINFGTIAATINSIALANGGAITNGGYGYLGALLEDGILVNGAAATVTNFATIAGGVALYAGGSVTNGATGDTIAAIRGAYDGVHIEGGAGTVTNFGAIHGHHDGAFGVDLGDGGRLTNGTALDRGATIDGYTGVIVRNAAGTIANFGTIQGFGLTTAQTGLYLLAGGSVTNGSADDTAALIEGAGGVYMAALGTVVNFGVIHGATASGVLLSAGGGVTNGGGGDRSALIEGYNGVAVTSGAATVNNFGTIEATGAYGRGVAVFAGGVVVNGSLNNATALIEGSTGLSLSGGTAAATNFATIAGMGDFGGAGAFLDAGESLTNGTAGDARALIEGFRGVYAYGSGNTVANFGTISGAGAEAVRFDNAGNVLVVEAGCAFVGAVQGGGGTLDLDTGVGTLTGLFTAGAVTVSGSMATTTFSNFATVEIGAAASFTSSGAVTIAAGQAVLDAGSLTLGAAKTTVTSAGLIEADGAGLVAIKGAVANTGALAVAGGTLTVAGAVTGNGSATINGGLLDLASSFTENVTFTGTTGILQLAQSQTYAGTVTGFSKSGKTSLDLDDIAFGKSTTATYSGTKKSGVLTVTDGTHTAHIALKGNYLSSTFVAVSDGHGGTLIHDPAAPIASTPPWMPPGSGQRFIAAMAEMGDSGAGPPGYAAGQPWRIAPATLTAPRTHFA